MKTKRILRTVMMAAGLLSVGQMSGETQPCYILSVEVSEEKQLTIEAAPEDAMVTYTITSQDAVPASGPSGLTIDLTGKYLLECRAWKQGNPQSIWVAYDINWQDPQIQTAPPSE